MRQIITFIFHPFQVIGRSQIVSDFIQFFNKRNWTFYLLSTLMTLIAVFFIFIFPNL